MKDKKLFNGDDGIIYVLGANGVTEETSIETSNAYDVISKAMDRSYDSVKRTFYRAVNKELLIKISENPIKYAFSKTGFERYTILKKQDSILKGASRSFEEFLRLYYWEALLRAVTDKEDCLEIKFKDIETGLGIDFAETLRNNPDETLSKLNTIFGTMVLPVDDMDFRPNIWINS